jgi:genome maintenance exonuclease 1
LYSHFIRVAGRVDLIAEWQGKLSIIDFKTSRKLKKQEWITNYFLQAAFYAAAFYERTGVAIKQSVILIATDEGTTQEFVEQTYPWLEEFIKIRKKYTEIHNI